MPKTAQELTATLSAANEILGSHELNPITNLEYDSPDKTAEELAKAFYMSEPGESPTDRTFSTVPKGFERIVGEGTYHPEFGSEYNMQQLAIGQRPAEQFAAFLNQAIVGEILGGSIEGAGYLWEAKDAAAMLDGTEMEWGNALSNIGVAIKDWTREATPVHVDSRDGRFAPHRFAWWMSNGPSVASTLSLLIPAIGVTKAIGAIGKIGNIGTKGFNAMSKAFGSTFAKEFQLGATALGQAAVSRHMENLMEANQVRQELLDQGYTEEEAALAASNTYRKQWLLLGQDIIQYRLFNQIMKGKAKKSDPKGLRGSELNDKVSKAMGYKLGQKLTTRPAQVVRTAIGEAGEEAYQFIVNEQSKLLAERIYNPSIKHSMKDVVKQNYDNGELWTSAWFGAIGAGVMMGAGRLLRKKAVAQDAEKRIKHIIDTGSSLNQAVQVYNDAMENGTELDKMTAWNNFKRTVARNAILNRNVENIKNMFRQVADETNEDALERFTVKEESADFMRKNPDLLEDMLTSIDDLVSMYEKNLDLVAKNKNIPEGRKAEAAFDLANNELQTKHALAELEVSEENVQKAADKVKGFTQPNDLNQVMSPTGQKIEALVWERTEINKLLQDLNKKLSSEEELGDLEELEYKVMIAKRNNRKDEIKQQLAELRKGYDKDTKAQDQIIKGELNPKEVNEYISEVKRNQYLKAIVDRLEKAREEYKVREELATPEEKAEAEEKGPAEGFDEEEHIAENDIVKYTDEQTGEEKKGRVTEVHLAEKDRDGDEIVVAGDNPENEYTVELLDENGIPTGQVVQTSGFITELDEKYDDESEVSIDPLSEDEETAAGRGYYDPYEAKINTGAPSPISNLSYSHYDPVTGKFVIRNTELDDLLSNPNTDYTNSKAEYYIDLNNEDTQKQLAKFIKNAKDSNNTKLANALEKFSKSQSLTSSDVNALLSASSGLDFADFVDTIPISVKVTIGSKEITGGIYLHKSNFKYIGVPEEHQTDEKTVQKYKNKKFSEARATRTKIIEHILNGKTPYTNNLKPGRGAPNTQIGSSFNVAEKLQTPVHEIMLAAARSDISTNYVASLVTGEDTKDTVKGFNYTSPGSVYAIVNNTLNGEKYALKLNKKKLSEEHAKILFEAFRIRAVSHFNRNPKTGDVRFIAGGRAQAQWKKGYTEAEGILPAQVIDLLVAHGKKATSVDTRKSKSRQRTERHRLILAQKQLWIETNYRRQQVFLNYGYNELTGKPYQIELTAKEQNENLKNFVQWATKYKNYAVHISSKKLEQELNKGFLRGQEFRIGEKDPIIRKKGQKYSSFLLENNILTTDAEITKNGTIFHSPTLDLGLVGGKTSNILISDQPVVIPTPTANQKVTPKKKAKVEESKSESKDVVEKQTVQEEDVEENEEFFQALQDQNSGKAGYKQIYRVYGTEQRVIPVWGKPFKHPELNAAGVTLYQTGEKATRNWAILEESTGLIVVANARTIRELRDKLDAVVKERGVDAIVKKIKESPKVDSLRQPSKKQVETAVNKMAEDTKKLKRDPKLAKKDKKVDEALEDKKKPEDTSFPTMKDAPQEEDESGKLSAKDFGKGLNTPGNIWGRASKPKPYVPQNVEKERAWIRKRFNIPSDEVTIERDIQKLVRDGKEHFGLFMRDGILIWEGAEEGTSYHEAFHRVSLLYWSDAERKSIYRAARNYFKLGAEATDRDIEEALAEAFRDYVIDREEQRVNRNLITTIKDAFRRLYNLLKYLITGRRKLTTTDIDAIFDEMYSGKYQFSKPKPENIAKLGSDYYASGIGNREFNYLVRRQDINAVIKTLTAVLINSNQVVDLENVGNLQWQPVMDVVTRHIDTMQEALDNNQVMKSEIDKVKNMVGMWKEIRADLLEDNKKNGRSVIIDRVNSELLSMGIRERYSKYNREETDDHESLDESQDPDIVGRFALDKKSSYETSSKDNARAIVKFMIRTLHETDEVNEYTGLQNFVDFNEVWHKLLFNLHDLDTVDGMIASIKGIGANEENGYPYFRLAEILEHEASEVKRNAFLTTFRKHRYQFISFLFRNTSKDGTRFTLQSSGENDTFRNQTLRWNEAFFLDDTIVETDKEGAKRLSSDFFTEASLNFNRIFVKSKALFNKKTKTDEEIREVVNEVIDALSQFHIEVDIETINHMLNNVYGREGEDSSENLFNMVSDMKSGIFDNETLLGAAKEGEVLPGIPGMFMENPVINTIGKSYAKVHPELQTDNVVGPGGNKYFTYAANSMLTDIIRDIRKKQGYVESKISKIYNAGSLVLEQMMDPEARENLELLTFNGLRQDKSADKGRDYIQITTLEDYLIKMAAISNNYMVLPILADRKQYHMVNGVKLFKNSVENFDRNSEGQYEYKISDEVVDRFYKYYLDEKKRIKEAKDLRNKYQEAKGDEKRVLKKKLIKNYHYSGNFNLKGGNAYRFIHFKGFGLNESMAEVKTKIRQRLNSLIEEEIKYASVIDIITRDQNNRISVKTIDGSFSTEYEDLILEDPRFGEMHQEDITDSGLRLFFGDFVVNNMVSIMESEKVFFTDPAFFAKNKKSNDVTDDMYKRWFGVASTGENITEQTEAFDETEFSVVTFNTQKFKSDYYDDLLEKHIELNQKRLMQENPELTEEQAEEKARILSEGALSGFLEVDATDGQMLISPEMYRSLMVRLGSWTKAEREAYAILQAEEEPTLEQRIRAMDVVMKPLKLVYIGKEEHSNLDTVVYDKMSMMPLFRWYVKGSHMEAVLDRMEGRRGPNMPVGELTPIDAFKYDSAVKLGGRVGIDFFTDPQKRDRITDFSDINRENPEENFIFYQKYGNLKFQVVTDVHEIERQTVGSQMFKIGFNNINKRAQYGEFGTGEDIIRTITEARNELSDIGVEEVKEKFGFENGKMSNQKLIELLRSDAEKSGRSEDFKEALRIEPNGSMFLELDAFPDRKWAYSRIMSIINSHTVDLNLPGNQLIQVSDYGFSSIDRQYRDELKFIRAKKGKTEVIELEARVSINLIKHLIPEYHKRNLTEINQYIQEKGLVAIGYRIPTQGQNSIIRMKIVEALDQQAGDIIQLPLEFTTLTGSDFDIDKLFVMMHNYKRDGSFEKITEQEGQTRTERKMALQNKLVDAFWEILGHEDHFLETTTPLGRLTGRLRDKAERYETWANGETSFELGSLESLTPRYQSSTKFTFTGSTNGIGPFALANAHHSLTQQAIIGLNTRLEFGWNDDILWFNRRYGNDDILISDWLSALIDAHVDAVKDPYIIKLNVNEATYDALNFLLRIGVGEDAFAFLSQPILKEYAQEFFNARGRIRAERDTRENEKTIAFNLVRERWLDKLGLDETQIANFTFDEEFSKVSLEKSMNQKQLTEDIKKSSKPDKDMIRRQLSILYHFSDIANEGDTLTKLVMASRVDTKKFGSTPQELRKFINDIEEVENSGRWVNLSKLINSQGVYEEGGTMLPTLFKNSVLLALNMFGGHSVYASKGFGSIFWEMLRSIPGGSRASRQTISRLTEEVFSYFAGQFFVDPEIGFGLTEAAVRKLVHPGAGSVFTELEKIKSGKHKNAEELMDNSFVKALIMDHSSFAPIPTHLRMPYRTLNDKYETDDYIDDLYALFKHEEQSVRDFARKLFVYSYYTSGFKNGLYSFHNYFSGNVYKATEKKNGDIASFNEYIKRLLKELNDDAMKTAHVLQAKKEIFLNNWDDTNLVPRVSIDPIVEAYTQEKDGIKYEIGYKLDLSQSKTRLGTNDRNDIIYSPYITINLVEGPTLLQFMGISPSDGHAIYRVTNKKGWREKGIVMREYGLKQEKSLADPTTFQKAVEAQERLEEEEAGFLFNPIYTISEESFVRLMGTKMKHIPLVDQVVKSNIIDSGSYINEYRGGLSDTRRGALTLSGLLKAVEARPVPKGNIRIDGKDYFIDQKYWYMMPKGNTTELFFRIDEEEYYIGVYDEETNNVIVNISVRSVPMNKYMEASDNRTGRKTSTLEQSELGNRTATTRTRPLGRIGQVVRFENQPQLYVITGVEQLTEDKVKDPNWIKEWSQKEMWTEEYFKENLNKSSTLKIGSWQTSFKKINMENVDLFEGTAGWSQSLSNKAQPIEIFVDGSATRVKGKVVDYGYGAVLNWAGTTYQLSGNKEDVNRELSEFVEGDLGPFSNPTTELLGTLEALRAFQDTAEHIVIYQDYKGVVNWGRMWDRSIKSAERADKPWKPTKDYIIKLLNEVESIMDKIEANGGSVEIRHIPNNHTPGSFITKVKSMYRVEDDVVQKYADGNNQADVLAKSKKSFNNFADLGAPTNPALAKKKEGEAEKFEEVRKNCKGE